MDTAKYLSRIGLSDVPAPTLPALFEIQKAHLYSVPYENFDILMGKRLSLCPDALYDKIVVNRRGGYCFELNELFGHLLRAIGYEVTDYFARFLNDEPEGVIPKRRHHVLKVLIPGEKNAYLCDVGVGTGSPTYPIALVVNEPQDQRGNAYKMTRDPFLGWVLNVQKNGAWKPLFSFTEEPQLPCDFEAISYFCENAPESIFNKKEMLAMRMDGGRKTLDGNEFRRFENDTVAVKTIDDPVEKAKMIREWFGIVI